MMRFFADAFVATKKGYFLQNVGTFARRVCGDKTGYFKPKRDGFSSPHQEIDLGQLKHKETYLTLFWWLIN